MPLAITRSWKRLGSSKMPDHRVPRPPLEYGDGDHLPMGRQDFPVKLIKAMVSSLASAGLKPHHVQWVRELHEWDDGPVAGLPFGEYWAVGNRVHDATFGFFEFWPGTKRPVLYKTSSRWTRFHHSKRHDEVEELTDRQALSLAKNYYKNLREELLLLEDKAKARYGAFGRSYYIWDPRTNIIDEHWDVNER